MTFPPNVDVLWERSFPRGSTYGDGERVGDVFLQPVKGTLHALGVDDGETRWIADYNAMIVAADAERVALVPRRQTWGPHSFVGLATDTGEVIWQRNLGANVRPGGRDNTSRTSLLRLRERSWIQVDRVAGADGAHLCEVDLETGEYGDLHWTPGAHPPVCVPEGIFSAWATKPAVWWFDGDQVREIEVDPIPYHVCVAAGRLVTWHKWHREYRAWDLASGERLGTFAGDAHMPALDDEVLVVPLGEEVVAWDLATGEARWRTRLQRKAYSACTFLGPYLVNAAAPMGHVLHRDTGEPSIAREPMRTPRVFDDATLWLRDDTLYRVALETGGRP